LLAARDRLKDFDLIAELSAAMDPLPNKTKHNKFKLTKHAANIKPRLQWMGPVIAGTETNTERIEAWRTSL